MQQTKEAGSAGKAGTAVQVVRSQMASPLPVTNCQELEWLGKMVAASQLFGEANPAVGLSIVAICHQEKKSWLWFMENWHMIKGKVTKKTDAMLADFRRIGGIQEPIERSSEKASCKFTIGKTKYTSTVTWDDCLHEPFVYNGTEKDIAAILDTGDEKRIAALRSQMKPKYKTPRARMQMLWARCVSDGIRVVAPECCQGVYTPEETDDFTQDVPAASATVSPAPYAQEVPAPAAEVTPAAEVAPTPAASPAQPPENTQANADASIECCPVLQNCPWSGKRWDDESVFTIDILKQALEVQHPAFTDEMKKYISGIIAKREAAAQK